MEFHNQRDLDIIQKLVEAADRTKAMSVTYLSEVRDYVAKAIAEDQKPRPCTGAVMLPLALRGQQDARWSPCHLIVIEHVKAHTRSNGVAVPEGNYRFDFCDPMCLVGSYLRRSNFDVYPHEDERVRKN